MSRAEAELFNDSILLFNTIELVDNYNHPRLWVMRKPVVIIKVQYTGSREAHKASCGDTDNIDRAVFLAIGARFCLTQSIV